VIRGGLVSLSPSPINRTWFPIGGTEFLALRSFGHGTSFLECGGIGLALVRLCRMARMAASVATGLFDSGLLFCGN
jgi:hypothetical protein